MQKIKKGDMVQVTNGNEIVMRGEVERIIRGWHVTGQNVRTKRNPNLDKVVVRGVNLRKKHQRRTGQTRTQTGIIEFEAPIHISNVMLVCPETNELTRVGIRRDENGQRIRFSKKSGNDID